MSFQFTGFTGYSYVHLCFIKFVSIEISDVWIWNKPHGTFGNLMMKEGKFRLSVSPLQFKIQSAICTVKWFSQV